MSSTLNPLAIAANDALAKDCPVILQMLSDYTVALPASRCVGTERVHLHRLDDEFYSARRNSKSIMLKLDTQGYESHVLASGAATLEATSLVEVEMSLVPLCVGAPTFLETHISLID